MKKQFIFCYSLLFSVMTMWSQINQKPNIIVILIDDMGFSDLSCFGGEIPTPNIDQLAQNGIRLNNFYNTARCCPTRASLLTGLYPHQAGIGYMTGATGDSPEYQGYLNKTSVTIAEVMKENGYFTMMTGKWHVGQKGDGGVTPWSRGFDRSLNAPAGGFYFKDAKTKIYLDGKDVTDSDQLPKDWYSTDLWTSYGLKFVDDAKKANKPFIWYLAHNAPHFPLQAPEEDIARFRGKYMKGWEVLRQERYDRQVKMGLIDKAYKLPAINPLIPQWESLSAEQKIKSDDVMAVYAAVVSRLDKSIGDLVTGLKERGEYENTIIMLMSDNGGNAEGGLLGIYKGENPGAVNSTLFIGQSWAELNNTPFWLYKHNTSEGGIAAPFIMSWPNGLQSNLKGTILNTPAHVIDIMPTCLDAAKGTYPVHFEGNKITPLEGISLLPLALNNKVVRKNPIFWEHEGNRAMREGKWKIVSNLKEPWQLYNLDLDRTETNNMAKKNPDLVKNMLISYESWYKRVGAKSYFNEPKSWQLMQGEKPSKSITAKTGVKNKKGKKKSSTHTGRDK